MVTVQKYRCEFCNTEYKSLISAEECEANHISPVKIKKSEYNSYNSDKCGFPKTINVLMDNGSVIKYVRGGVC